MKYVNERLTWNSVAPAPFESGWSIFLKILAHNYMAMRELVELIRRQDVQVTNVNPFDLSNSAWIDFEKFGSLLGVVPDRLKTGFLDTLHFHSYSDRSVQYKIKHCPKCVELGYHCTLFDLALITECPWHQCELRAGCLGCCTSSTINGVSRYYFQGVPACKRCKLPLGKFLNLTQINSLDSEMEDFVKEKCLQFMNWWVSLRLACKQTPFVLRNLAIHEGQLQENKQISPVLLGYGMDVCPFYIGWKLSEAPSRAQSMEWTERRQEYLKGGMENYANSDTEKMYRSVRRHIFKRFVKSHKCCFQTLMSLSREDGFALCSDEICVVALSYLVWRMSNEGICNIEGLKRPKNDIFNLRLMGPEYHRMTISASSKLRWSYCGFFGIWYQLDEYIRNDKKVSINFEKDCTCDGFLHWQIEESCTLAGEVKASTKANNIKIVYPGPLPLEKHPKSNICQNDLVDVAIADNYSDWEWCVDPDRRDGQMFRCRSSFFGKRNHSTHMFV